MTILEILSNQIQDELSSTVHDCFRGIDPVYQHIDQTSIDVVQADAADMGYKWEVSHTFGGGVAGLMESGYPLGPDARQLDGTTVNYLNESDPTGATSFPNPLASPHTGVFRRKLQLHKNVGNFNIPTDWMQMDRLSAAVIKQVARDIKAVGMMRALKESISFYCDTDASGYNVLCNAGTVTSNANNTVTFTITGGRIAYFRPGMTVQEVGDLTKAYVVTAVDPLNATITIASAGADFGTVTPIIETGDTIIWGGSRAYTPMVTWGLNDWIKDSGYLFQTGASAGFSLDEHPEFKSLVKDAGSQHLTESLMNSTVGAFMDAYGDLAPDSIITTWDISLDYLDNLGNQTFERNGAELKYNSGFAEITYMFNGRKINWLISSMVLPGTLYALRLNDGNIKRYVPPKIGGKDDRVGAEVEFLNTLTGSSSIFKVAHNASGASTSVLEAPFWQYRLVAPVDARSVKIENIAVS